MHGASRLELSAMSFEAMSRYILLEERHRHRWLEDEARADLGALQCLPKTTPSQTVS